MIPPTEGTTLYAMPRRRALFACMVLLVAACSDPPTGQDSGVPLRLEIASGDLQSGEINSALPNPLVVRVVRNGKGVAGIEVHWDSDEAGGLVTHAASPSVTNADGYASVQRHLGARLGGYGTTASIMDGQVASVRFTSYAQLFGATRMGADGDSFERVDADTIEAALRPYGVRVSNYLGLPVPGVPVHWTPDSVVTFTDSDGTARHVTTLGTAVGPYRTQASVPGLAGSPVIFDAIVRPGNPVAMKVIEGDGQLGVAGRSLNRYRVEVVDRRDNAVAGVTVEWTIASGSGTLDSHHVVTGPHVYTTRPSASVVHTLGAAEGEVIATATAPAIAGDARATFRSIAVSAVVSVAPSPCGPWDYGSCEPAFMPALTEIGSGETVGWLWSGSCDVVFEDDIGPPASAPVRASGTHTRTFPAPGDYRYRCTRHSSDFDTGMVGVVRVR